MIGCGDMVRDDIYITYVATMPNIIELWLWFKA